MSGTPDVTVYKLRYQKRKIAVQVTGYDDLVMQGKELGSGLSRGLHSPNTKRINWRTRSVYRPHVRPNYSCYRTEAAPSIYMV